MTTQRLNEIIDKLDEEFITPYISGETTTQDLIYQIDGILNNIKLQLYERHIPISLPDNINECKIITDKLK